MNQQYVVAMALLFHPQSQRRGEGSNVNKCAPSARRNPIATTQAKKATTIHARRSVGGRARQPCIILRSRSRRIRFLTDRNAEMFEVIIGRESRVEFASAVAMSSRGEPVSASSLRRSDSPLSPITSVRGPIGLYGGIKHLIDAGDDHSA